MNARATNDGAGFDRTIRILALVLTLLVSFGGAAIAYGTLAGRAQANEQRVTQIEERLQEDMRYIRTRLDQIADRIP